MVAQENIRRRLPVGPFVRVGGQYREAAGLRAHRTQVLHLSLHLTLHRTLNLALHLTMHPTLHLTLHPTLHLTLHHTLHLTLH